MKTTKFEITSLDGWVKVAQNPADILIQVRTSDLLEVFAGAADPVEGDTGILLYEDGSLDFGASGLPTGTSFYVRLIRTNEQATIVVMENGEALGLGAS